MMQRFNFANYVAARTAAATRRKGGAPKPGAAGRTPKARTAATKAETARKLRAARAAGVAEGARAERARIGAILAAAGLGDHEAARLAIGTDLPAKAAAARLSPSAQAAKILAAAGRDLPPELAAAQRRLKATEGAR